VSQAANPIVKDGKMIWNVMVKANWIRDRRSAVISIAILAAEDNYLKLVTEQRRATKFAVSF
jgi:hypothetical protein